MNPRPAYLKLKEQVIATGMTWQQLKAKDWQFDINALLTVDEKKALRRYEPLVIRWLKGDFKEDQYTGTLKADGFAHLDAIVADLTAGGLSSGDSQDKTMKRLILEWWEARNV